jgi:hypothetical protein
MSINGLASASDSLFFRPQTLSTFL